MMPQTIVDRYRDLNLIFTPNPVRKDISTLSDVDAVKRAVMNLVLTKHYERPFHPEIGCNVTALLFDNATDLTAINVKRSIQDVIGNFEPRVQLQNVVVNVSPDQNGYNATIQFYILNIPVLQNVDFFLQRLR
jgi:phage baseplate assembly protein W